MLISVLAHQKTLIIMSAPRCSLASLFCSVDSDFPLSESHSCGYCGRKKVLHNNDRCVRRLWKFVPDDVKSRHNFDEMDSKWYICGKCITDKETVKKTGWLSDEIINKTKVLFNESVSLLSF